MRVLLLVLLLAGPASAETATVLSSDSKPYRDAFEGLREALGPDAPPRTYPLDADPSVDAVVAFGAKAALAKRGNAYTLIVALAPGYVPTGREADCVVTIAAMPAPAAMIANLRSLQKNLTNIWVPWISPAFSTYMDSLKKIGLASGITVAAVRLGKAEELPTQLRAMTNEVGAILVPPDPELISRSTFEMIKQASFAKKLPLYAPFPNLVAEGATASIGVTFREMGHSAGTAALAAKGNTHCGSTVYPERTEVRISC